MDIVRVWTQSKSSKGKNVHTDGHDIVKFRKQVHSKYNPGQVTEEICAVAMICIVTSNI